MRQICNAREYPSVDRSVLPERVDVNAKRVSAYAHEQQTHTAKQHAAGALMRQTNGIHEYALRWMLSDD